MALPWLQIVQLVPSIVDVSRELLRKSRKQEPVPDPSAPDIDTALVESIARLEENERRQAELVSQMAEQMDILTKALTALHLRMKWLAAGAGLAVIVASAALIVALTGR
jgi:hypothetical protein